MGQLAKSNRLEGITRRDFTVKSALAILSSVPITLTACGDSGNSSSPAAPTPQPTPTADVQGAVSMNHGHEAVIEGATLTAGNSISLDILGTADHTHTVDLSSDEIGQIASGARVQKESSNNVDHTHIVTFN